VGILSRAALAMAAVGAAGAIAAGGVLPASAATVSGVRYQQVQTTTILLGPGLDECSASALSAAGSTGSPAYVSEMVTNFLPDTCIGWLQDSVNGGAWTNVSPQQSAPASPGPNNPTWFKTANYYAGPGTSVRACVEVVVGTTPPAKCTSAVTLPASTGTPADDATPAYYAERQAGLGVTLSSGSSPCFGDVNSSTAAKGATTQAALSLQGGPTGTACSGWLESSADNGTTWTQTTSTYSVAGVGGTVYAFSPAVADGTGQLVRACVQTTGAKSCGKPW
jgi:hypothetical protein